MKVMTGGREAGWVAQHQQEVEFINHLLRLVDVEVARLGSGGGGVTPEILELLEKTVSISPQATASLKLRLGWRLNRIAEVGSYL